MPPTGGWRKRHQQAARRRGDELRAKGRRALYVDTVRWWAHRKHGDDYQAAASDPTMQVLWEQRRGNDRDSRMAALDELGILEQDGDGNWKYSNAWLAWLFEEMP